MNKQEFITRLQMFEEVIANWDADKLQPSETVGLG